MRKRSQTWSARKGKAVVLVSLARMGRHEQQRRTRLFGTSPCIACSCARSRPFGYFNHRALIHWMYRNYANALSISIRNRFTYIVRCAVVELCLTQRANPNLQGSKPKSCATGQPYGTVRSVGPVRGGLGYRWLVTPLNHIHLGEAGWTIWEAIHAPFLSII